MQSFRFVVGAEESGERVDRFLALRLEPLGVSRARARVLVEERRVVVEGKPTKPSQRVAAGEAVEVRMPPPPPIDPEPEAIPLTILHEDEHLVVVDKPPHMVVHPTRGHNTGTLVHALLHHVGTLSTIGAPRRPGIIHRLDQGTSGVIVVARGDRSHLAIKRQFQARTVEKEYRALCYGTPSPPEGTMDLPIGRSRQEPTRMRVLGADAKPATTHYRLIESHPGLSYLALFPHTGRTHQIRVHLTHSGHPIVGDPTYGGRSWKNLHDLRVRRLAGGLERPFLHARSLSFDHPATGERLTFEAPLPEDLDEVLEGLRALARG